MCSFKGIEVCKNRWISCALFICALPILLSILPIFHIIDGFDAAVVKGQRILICGASGGIGEQMAYKYAELGAHIGLVARREKQLEIVAKEALARGAASVVIAPGDMSSEKSILSVMKKVLEDSKWNGEMDVVILNHAYQEWGWLVPDAKDIYSAQIGAPAKGGGGSDGFKFIDTQISVNFVSFVKLAIASLPSLSRAGNTSGTDSHIIAVSSGAGKVAVPKQSVYGGTKHALHGFFDSFRLELEAKKLPVKVTVVVLGQVSTDKYNEGAGAEMSMPTMKPEDAAASIISGGMSGIEELYVPLNQFLHVVSILRPLYGVRWLLDRLTLKMMHSSIDL
jgi:corticosteroid 11-beta-dehydrogenase isozyme 1